MQRVQVKKKPQNAEYKTLASRDRACQRACVCLFIFEAIANKSWTDRSFVVWCKSNLKRIARTGIILCINADEAKQKTSATNSLA